MPMRNLINKVLPGQELSFVLHTSDIYIMAEELQCLRIRLDTHSQP